ncbi:MAG: WbqC family protein [Thermodesulfobacteriota bacterium]
MKGGRTIRTLSASQPYFAPFGGFFAKVHGSDIFVIMDSVQFPRGTTWITRNRFKNHQGTLWLTIPVWKKGLGLQRIDRVTVCHEGRWQRKHLESLKSAYAHAPYFADHLEFLAGLFSQRYERLIDFNLAVLRHLMKHLDIRTEVELLSDLNIQATGSSGLVDMCRTLGATRFLAQAPARKYLDIPLIEKAGIELSFFQPPSPVYPQLWGDFLPNLSVFDLLFNLGPKAKEILFVR